MVTIEIRGVKRLNKFVIHLDKNTQKELDQVGVEFMKAFRKRAKLMSPRWSGTLADSIMIPKKKKGKSKTQIKLTVDSPYGIFQEEGFKPHFVAFSKSTRSGYTFGDWALGHGILPEGVGLWVKGSKPFVKPAFERTLGDLPNILNIALNKAMKES